MHDRDTFLLSRRERIAERWGTEERKRGVPFEDRRSRRAKSCHSVPEREGLETRGNEGLRIEKFSVRKVDSLQQLFRAADRPVKSADFEPFEEN